MGHIKQYRESIEQDVGKAQLAQRQLLDSMVSLANEMTRQIGSPKRDK